MLTATLSVGRYNTVTGYRIFDGGLMLGMVTPDGAKWAGWKWSLRDNGFVKIIDGEPTAESARDHVMGVLQAASPARNPGR